MSKTVVIHQPDFMPYLGFFHRFLHTDLWVILDNVQFIQKSSMGFHNRDKIKTAQGDRWLTVSVQKCPIETNINEVMLSIDPKWREKNLNLIKQNYAKASFFSEIFPYIEELYSFECVKLIDFNLKSIEILNNLLGIEIESVIASTLTPEGTKNEFLVDILKKVNGTTYCSGVGAKNYLVPKIFEDSGIKVVWQDFKHPVYPQLYGEYIPYLSSIDLLFNCGVEASRKIVRS